MKEDFVENRRRALEDSFFANENARLIDKMRAKVAAEQQKQALADVSGIQDDKVLATMVGLGITGETMAAMSLAPMVIVAWADGEIDPKEKEAVMKGVVDAGVSQDSPAVELVSNWLKKKPEAALEKAWEEYIQSLKGHVDGDAFTQLKTDILGRARQVAEAAGGYLGLATVSKEEIAALERLAKAFS